LDYFFPFLAWLALLVQAFSPLVPATNDYHQCWIISNIQIFFTLFRFKTSSLEAISLTFSWLVPDGSASLKEQLVEHVITPCSKIKKK
jgi:hypothetical protein